MTTRDEVITLTKEWLDLWHSLKSVNDDFESRWAVMEQWEKDQLQDAQDVVGPVISLAYNRAKEALIAYTKEREEVFAAHDRMLETIEQTLQGEINNG